MISRRKYLSQAALLAGGAALTGSARAMTRVEGEGQHEGHAMATPAAARAKAPSKPAISRKGLPYTPVVTPDGSTLPFVMKDGVKEFHLIAEPVKREFAPGMMVNSWGYNGSTPGPTIEAVEGDRVRILVTNKLPEHTSVHWHGIFLPNGMDGVGGLNQPHIKPGETFTYEFTLRQHGTHMYHPHADEVVQMALGMMGFFIIHPRVPARVVHRDFCILPHMWFIDPGTMTPNPNIMLDFNMFTFNSRSFPGTAPLICRLGDRVRVRLANLNMTSHPIHIHGVRVWVVETDGGQIPETAWWPETTVNVIPGTTRAFEFVADVPGDWAFHCHKPHHAMNAMGHDIPNVLGVDQSGVEEKIRALVPGYMAMGKDGMAEHAQHAEHMKGLPNTLPMMTGTGPFGPIEMGGMFTVVKVRENLKNYDEDPGWYQYPEGTVAFKSGEAAAKSPDEKGSRP
ncbi:MAG: copper oxidase [Vicinamibacteria bacterium]|jgi:FtsP/CotA-like multicopper oxidase with cupredoxin domain|nr:copper oxidase [Vicinamibacteria bacterium]MBP9944889.1 copper oxidase [Vicinamibacteria bacterium]